jgi:hypothetical protein
MDPLRMRIDRIVDFGSIVSLVGLDLETQMPVTIHVDHRPFAAAEAMLNDAGLALHAEYAADRLLLDLTMRPDQHADTVRLVECAATDADPKESRCSAPGTER